MTMCWRFTGNFHSDLHSLFKSNHKKYRFIILLYRKSDCELTYSAFLSVQQYTYGGRTTVRRLVVCFSLCDFLNRYLNKFNK